MLICAKNGTIDMLLHFVDTSSIKSSKNVLFRPVQQILCVTLLDSYNNGLI